MAAKARSPPGRPTLDPRAEEHPEVLGDQARLLICMEHFCPNCCMPCNSAASQLQVILMQGDLHRRVVNRRILQYCTACAVEP